MQVLSTEICNTDQTLCNYIAAVDTPSKAVVEVKNTGGKSSSYTVSLDSCTHPVVDIPSRTLTLAANTTEEMMFEVFFTLLSLANRLILFASLHAHRL